MKITIDAKGVHALLEHAPEGTVQLAKAAATQVADQLAKRVTQQRVEALLTQTLREMTTGGWRSVLTAEAQKALNEAAAAAIAKAFDPTQREHMRAAARELVDAHWKANEAAMLRYVNDKLDAMIGARLVALLAKTAAS